MTADINTRMAVSGIAQSVDPPPGKKVSKAPAGRGQKQAPVNQQEAVLGKTEKNAQPGNAEKVEALVNETVKNIDELVKNFQVDLKYEVDEKTNDVVIKVFKKGTDELIRQVPPEAILKLKERISDLLGIIYDKTV